jgi:hypothetical protein
MGSNIPEANRDASLIIRLLPAVMGGIDQQRLDKAGQLYLRVLCRLIDKAFEEYNLSRQYMEKERKSKNKLEFMFAIVNHLENCINAMNRTAKTFESAENNGIFQLMSEGSKSKIRSSNISPVRNKMEHIEQYIQRSKVRGSLFLSLDANYEKVCVNNRCVELKDLVEILETYHKGMLEIIGRL